MRACVGPTYAACSAGHLVAAMETPIELTERYNILSVTSQEGRFFNADGVIEKPTPVNAPSSVAVIERYILD